MSSVLDSDEGLAVEVLEAVDREIASLLLLTARSSPSRAAGRPPGGRVAAERPECDR